MSQFFFFFYEPPAHRRDDLLLAATWQFFRINVALSRVSTTKQQVMSEYHAICKAY